MDLFDINGHLTNEGLDAILSERLDELQRLEAAEHLSFCDECILKYTACLESAVLIESDQSVLPAVKKSLRQKLISFSFKKYATAVAAVAFAFIVGSTGALEGILDSVPKDAAQGVTNSITSGIAFIGNSITQFFHSKEPTIPRTINIKIPDLKDINVPEFKEPAIPKDVSNSINPSQSEKDKDSIKNPAKDTALSPDNPAKKVALKENSALDIFSFKNNK